LQLRTRTYARGKFYCFPPFNLLTMSEVFGKNFTPSEAKMFMQEHCSLYRKKKPDNYEEYMLFHLGPVIYDMFVDGYMKKAWACPARDLPITIGRRIGVRYSFDDRVFSKKYQGYPLNGYMPMIKAMLDHPNVECETNVDFFSDRINLEKSAKKIIYSGKIDEYFDYEFGRLEYRSLRFEQETLSIPDYQGNPVINYTTDEVDWTRITEHKHFCFKKSDKTIITKEFSIDHISNTLPCYPVKDKKNTEIFDKYQDKVLKMLPKIYFGGRLGSYQYLDMDQTIGQALFLAEQLINNMKA